MLLDDKVVFMGVDTLSQAIALSKSGRKEEARLLLQETIRANPQSELAWFWYADTLPTNAERIQALKWCLKYNPTSTAARKALDALSKKTDSSTTREPPLVNASPSIYQRWEETEYCWQEVGEDYYCGDCGEPLVICGACSAVFCLICQQATCILCHRPLVEGSEEEIWAQVGFGIVRFEEVSSDVEDEVEYNEVYES